MDLLALCLCHETLTARSIRLAAARTRRAPSTISGALARMEAEIAVPMVRRKGASLVLTLEAERRMPGISMAVAKTHELMREVGRGEEQIPSVRIETLMRFAVVARSGSIRAAARSLNVGQPQLSRQMSDLEKVLGCSLLARTARGVAATALGNRIMQIGEAIVEEWEQLSRAAAVRFRRGIMTWRIGTVLPLGHESSIARMLAKLTVNWKPNQSRHPLHISGHTADELISGLKTRQFDLVLLDHKQVPREFRSQLVLSSELVLVAAAGVLNTDCELSDVLRRLPLALPSVRSGIRQVAMRYLERQLGPDIPQTMDIVEIDAVPVIINLVAHYGYLSVLPLSAVERLPYQFSHISLGPEFRQELVMVWRRSGLPDTLLDAVYRSTLHEQSIVETSRRDS